MAGYETATYIKGHRPIKSAKVVCINIDDVNKEIEFRLSKTEIRDIIIENIGENPVYMMFAKESGSEVYIPIGNESVDDQIRDGNSGWMLAQGAHLIINHTDGTFFCAKCKPGQMTKIQFMYMLYSE